MQIPLNAIGFRFDVGTFYDLSAATTLEIKLKKPDATVLTKIAIINSSAVDPFRANRSAYYLSISGDLDVAGVWEIWLHMIAPGLDLDGQHASFIVG